MPIHNKLVRDKIPEIIEQSGKTIEIKFSTVRERDMDLLFLEAISSDIDFANMIVDNTKWAEQNFSLIQ